MKRTILVLFVMGALLALGTGSGFSKSTAKSDSAWLGVYTQSVDYELADAFELGSKYGAVVNEIIDDSPAEKAGLKEEDVIIAVDGDKVTDSEDLVYLLEDHSPGDKIVLTIISDDSEKKIDVTLEEHPKGFKYDRDKGHLKYHGYSHSSGFGQRGYIGVTLTDLSEQLAEYFGVDDDKGALITSVKEDSPAAKAGLKAGDVIVAVDNEDIVEGNDVRELIEEFEEGDKVSISFIRDRSKQNTEVEVAEIEDHERYYFNQPDLSVLKLPKPGGLLYGDFPELDIHWDESELQDQLDQLRDELENIEIDFDEDDFRSEMKELREELKKMKKELRKELDDIHNKLK